MTNLQFLQHISNAYTNPILDNLDWEIDCHTNLDTHKPHLDPIDALMFDFGFTAHLNLPLIYLEDKPQGGILSRYLNNYGYNRPEPLRLIFSAASPLDRRYALSLWVHTELVIPDAAKHLDTSLRSEHKIFKTDQDIRQSSLDLAHRLLVELEKPEFHDLAHNTLLETNPL